MRVIIVIDRGRDKTGGVSVQGCSGQVHLTHAYIHTYIHRTYIHKYIHAYTLHTYTHTYICVCMPVCVIIVIDGGRGKTGGGEVEGCSRQVHSPNIYTYVYTYIHTPNIHTHINGFIGLSH